ncbi:ABC transporter permease [Xenorhabdus sp. Reich]|uniref:ABC transporter permease n=1 Tax=Xenorhabdus littoralis TaxID=2582835 RepID=A0ABU4SL06_9GAMM|nr:ABC-2 family transporter protein [Xenorhabdus sp. Reich]MDX7999329.1 ABC transporter permease [Xenorhabdus sp. Reich]
MFNHIKRSLLLWRVLIIQSFSRVIAYRAQSIIWLLGGIMPIAVMFVWLGLAKGGEIGGYTASDFAVYFLSMYLVRQLTAIWVMRRLDSDIRRGELSMLLLRPVSPLYNYVSDHVGEMMVRGPIIWLVFISGIFLTGNFHRLDIGNLLTFIPALALAWIIIFHLYYCLGLLAFWINNAMAFDPLLWALYTILGGILIPLDLYPESIATWLKLLPFASALDFPVQMILGKLELFSLLVGFGVQLFWVILLTLVRIVLWNAGLKRYSASGA